jgi:hypothetical protein
MSPPENPASVQAVCQLWYFSALLCGDERSPDLVAILSESLPLSVGLLCSCPHATCHFG